MVKDKGNEKQAKQKVNEEKKKDLQKRNDEMAEGKSPHEVAEIYSKGGKYYCAECQSELPIRKSCPNCKKEIDWERLNFERR